MNADASLNATVNVAISACEPIVSDRPEFFPEYTDHGPQHNEDVLLTAITILTDQAVSRLTTQDFAALSLAVLLHDCGMHLSGDAFKKVISQDNKQTTFLDETTWADLWSEFLLEAKRFDGRQLRSMFGSNDPVSAPPDDPANYTKRDRLLIGEFLRRHHPRLAHEISLYGFPAVDDDNIQIVRKEAGDIAEVSGLIARSHGMPLRRAVDIFAERFHEREYQSIHPPIIMAALRIADYLQIQPERAPNSHLRLHKLRSPFSEGEWKVHQSVRNITPADTDPEAILVDAKPETVETFLKFKNWANSFQAELDATWASLGEVYGRFGDQGFDKFQLKLRRLRTSIDDEAKFSRTAPYVPSKIAFEASSPDLLGLLVAPLYGNRPEVGLRELIQNSVDAVIEREFVEGKRPTGSIGEFNADVVVRPVYEDDTIKQIIVEDRGIGMNADVIQNYFLRAGASFRSSSYWKKSFTTEDGKSNIARTGRFGIGVLSCFLLGKKVQVQTRRFDSKTGLQFTAELDRDFIEVVKCQCQIGTKITIEVDEEKQATIGGLFEPGFGSRHTSKVYRKYGPSKWDWYCNDYPVLLRLDKKQKKLPGRFTYRMGNEWVSIEVEGYSSVLWSRRTLQSQCLYKTKETALFSNGIFVFEPKDYGKNERIIDNNKLSADISISTPTILITDKDGRLPVNLQRDGLAELDETLCSTLRFSLSRELIAEAIAKAPELSPFSQEGNKHLSSRYLSCDFKRGQAYKEKSRPHWSWEDGGWRLADVSVATRKQWLLVLFDDFDLSYLDDKREHLEDVSVVWQHAGASAGNFNDIRRFFRDILKGDFWNRIQGVNSQDVYLRSQLVFSKGVLDKINSGTVPNYMRDLMDSRIVEFGRSYSVSTTDISHPLLGALSTLLSNQAERDFSFAFVGGENQYSPKEAHILPTLWREFIGEKPIPIDFEDRRTAHPIAFEQLGERIEYHRKLLLKKSK
ncbi:MAG: ATP-binding protein [Hyphomicrobiales bacterium]|nr:ATP-binding protein [Hyphomicrobiales bacterium]